MLKGPLTILIAVVAIFVAAWGIKADFDENPASIPSAASPHGEVYADSSGGLYMLSMEESRLWYVHDDSYQAVESLDGEWIYELERTASGQMYAIGENGVWLLDGTAVTQVGPGEVPDSTERYELTERKGGSDPPLHLPRYLIPPDPR